MTTGHAGWVGQTPKALIKRARPNTEKVKYLKLWKDVPAYRENAPGEILATKFMEVVRPKADSKVIDFGCGTGRGAMMLAFLG